MRFPLSRKALEKVTPYTPGKPVEELERELGIGQAIKLASNENALGPSPKAVAAIEAALSKLNRYPDSHSFYLVEKLSKKLGVDPKQLIVGNGSDEIITLAVRAFLEPTDEVVVASPTFLIYEIAAQIAGVSVHAVPLRDLRYDLVRMRKAITPRTKLVFIANPDNPTGTFVTKSELEAFLKDLPEGVAVFLDEAYAELVEAPDYPEGLSYLDQYPVIVTRTFSKAYGLSGLRVGYGVASAELIEPMQKVREPFNVNSLAQVAAAAALEDTDHLEATRELLREEKPILYQAFQSLNLEAVPSATNFILFRVGTRAQEVAKQLLRNGIIIRHMKAWGLEEYLRVTIGLKQENQKFIQALKEALA